MASGRELRLPNLAITQAAFLAADDARRARREAITGNVEELPERPLHAWVARSNVGSVRVLEKCGFEPVEERAEHDEHAGRVVPELLYELR